MSIIALVAACTSRSSRPASTPRAAASESVASQPVGGPISGDECVADGECARLAPAGSVGECRAGRCVPIPVEELDCGPAATRGAPKSVCPTGYRCVQLPVGTVPGEGSDTAPQYRCRRVVAANTSPGPA